MKNTLRTVVKEYGIPWGINRSLYSAKLKLMTNIPPTERLFEKKVDIQRVDLFDFDIDRIKKFLLELDNEEKKKIIEIADKAISGKITGFSSIELDFGNPINWHLNPLTGIVSDKAAKWYAIPDFDQTTGDIKVIWEASRLTYFLYFARAYIITGDIKYYKAFSNHLRNWLNENRYSYGANYKCGQEATLRMINGMITYSVFKHFNLISKIDEESIYLLIESSYKKVLSNFFYAYKCIKNNHTFTEILGVIIGAWCSKDYDKLAKSYELMDQEIIKQFLPDGGFSQYSFNYHRFTLQIFEVLLKISGKIGFYPKETKRIEDSVLQMYHVQSESGDVPNYGSNDGALIFPLTVCSYRNFKPVLNTVYALITGKKLYENGNHDEELLWFTGELDQPISDNIKRKSMFDESGFYVIHRENGFIMTCLQEYKSRPAHMDQLHVDLWHKDINILCDNGTYSYASKLGEELSTTSGHNTVKISGKEQMNKQGAFFITDWTKKDYVFHSDNQFSGKYTSRNGYSHERKIILKKNRYTIYDNVFNDNDTDTCEIVFHTPCDVRMKDGNIEFFSDEHHLASIKVDGELTIEKSFRSLYYLKKEDITRICISQKFIDGFCSSKVEILLHE